MRHKVLNAAPGRELNRGDGGDGGDGEDKGDGGDRRNQEVFSSQSSSPSPPSSPGLERYREKLGLGEDDIRAF